MGITLRKPTYEIASQSVAQLFSAEGRMFESPEDFFQHLLSVFASQQKSLEKSRCNGLKNLKSLQYYSI